MPEFGSIEVMADGTMSIKIGLDGDTLRSDVTTTSSQVLSSSSLLSSESSDLHGHAGVPPRSASRVEVVVVPPIVPGGIVVVTVPRSYTPGEFDRIREAVLAAVESSGACVAFLPEGVSLASLSPEELWKMGLGVFNMRPDEDVELPEDRDVELGY